MTSKIVEAWRMLRPVLRIRTLQGRPIIVGERQIIPVVRSIFLAAGRPGGPFAAGLVRNRPVAVLEIQHGQSRRTPIPDPTRRVLLALMGAGCTLMLGAWYLRRRRRRPGWV